MVVMEENMAGWFFPSSLPSTSIPFLPHTFPRYSTLPWWIFIWQLWDSSSLFSFLYASVLTFSSIYISLCHYSLLFLLYFVPSGISLLSSFLPSILPRFFSFCLLPPSFLHFSSLFFYLSFLSSPSHLTSRLPFVFSLSSLLLPTSLLSSSTIWFLFFFSPSLLTLLS